MTYESIICEADPMLTVYIDRERAVSGVFYRYDDGEEQSTMFQTADMPIYDQAAAGMVNEWIS